MILAICVVVDESKCLDTPILEFVCIFHFHLGIILFDMMVAFSTQRKTAPRERGRIQDVEQTSKIALLPLMIGSITADTASAACPSQPGNLEMIACALRTPPGSHRPVLRRTPGRTPFHPCAVGWRSYHDQLHGPIRFPQHLFSVHDHGRQRSGGGRSTLSTLTLARGQHTDCTLSRLRAEEYDRPVTQSIATPEPSSRTIPTLDRTLVAR